MKALIISADKFEDSELLVPYYRLKEVGIEVIVASLSRGAIRGKHGYEVAVDKTLDEVNPDDYEILVLPGGAAPAMVRKERKALEIARSFFARNKPVSAICQGMLAGHQKTFDCNKAFSETDFTEDLRKFDVPTPISPLGPWSKPDN